ncbi:MAG: NAD-dependent epimerase/dehydratase family protein, partial [Acidimicrobiales bacterium]
MSRTATGAIEAGIDRVDPTMHPHVVVTGAAGIIGSRVARQIAQTLPQSLVSGIDRFSGSSAIDEFHLADLATADLLPLLRGVDVLVHCSFNLRADAVTSQDGRVDLAIMRRVLKAAALMGVKHVVVLSSAMVYGAWPDNPMPITEDAPVRPNPEYGFALHMASVEAVARNWQSDADGRKLTIMRPAVLVTEERRGGLSDVLASASVIRSESGDAPAQYLHVDDLASAIAIVVGTGADGVFNIAPDSWISADDLAALAGPKPRLHLPDPAARLVSAIRFRL